MFDLTNLILIGSFDTQGWDIFYQIFCVEKKQPKKEKKKRVQKENLLHAQKNFSYLHNTS